MKRGDIIIAAAPGDFGKPRPAVVVQSDFFNDSHASIVICPLTSDIILAPLYRIDVQPTIENGVRSPSQIMVDKIMALRRGRVGAAVGTLEQEIMLRVDRTLALWLGLAD